LAHPCLPPDCRHMLLVKLGDAFMASSLVTSLMGRARSQRVMREACQRSCLTLVDHTQAKGYPALVEHLRMKGDLTATFILRLVAHGKIDFFGAILVSLTGQNPARTRALLAGGRDLALAAAFRKAGLAAPTHA